MHVCYLHINLWSEEVAAGIIVDVITFVYTMITKTWTISLKNWCYLHGGNWNSCLLEPKKGETFATSDFAE